MKFDLQFFAEPDDTEDDDVNLVDDDDSEEELDDEAIAALLEDGETDEKGEDESDDDGGKKENDDQSQNQNQNVTFTPEQQALFNQALNERLMRERSTYQPIVQEALALTEEAGMDLRSMREYIRTNKIKSLVEDEGLSEEEARKQVEKEEENRRVKAENLSLKQQRENDAKQNEYTLSKQKYMNNLIVRQYMAEIDNFANFGLSVGFETAMNYIIGQKVLSGELQNKIKKGAEQKTMRDIAKRGRTAPINGSQSGSPKISLTKQELRLAAAMGVSAKEYAKEKMALRKKK